MQVTTVINIPVLQIVQVTTVINIPVLQIVQVTTVINIPVLQLVQVTTVINIPVLQIGVSVSCNKSVLCSILDLLHNLCDHTVLYSTPT